jgi:hypothetical protein
MVESTGLIPGAMYMDSSSGDVRRCNTQFRTISGGVNTSTVFLESVHAVRQVRTLHAGFGFMTLSDLPDPDIVTPLDTPLQNCSPLLDVIVNLQLATVSLDDGLRSAHKPEVIANLYDTMRCAPVCSVASQFRIIDWNHIFSFEEIHELLVYLTTLRPKHCRLVELARTPETYGSTANLPIWAVEVSAHNLERVSCGDVPCILYVSAIHARERGGVNACLAYMYWLLLSTCLEAATLRSTTTTVFVPVADPATYVRDDSYTVWDESRKTYTNIPGLYLRKNSNPGACVDIDRNFGAIIPLNAHLEATAPEIVPRRWRNDPHLRCNGGWGLEGSSGDPGSPVYRGEHGRRSGVLGWLPLLFSAAAGGGSEIETRALQSLCFRYRFGMAVIHAGIGYRLLHPRFPINNDAASDSSTVSQTDQRLYTTLLSKLSTSTRYNVFSPQRPVAGCFADWLYTLGQERKYRGAAISGDPGTLAIVAETGSAFYPSFEEMGDVTHQGFLLNLAIHNQLHSHQHVG